MRHLIWVVCVAGCAVGVASPVFASGGGSMGGMGSMSMPTPRSPEDTAKSAYNDGVRAVAKARDYDDDVAKADKEDKRIKLQEKAHKQYEKARKLFVQATQGQPDMAEAWNYVGFTSRHLGEYDLALSAYAKALELKPGYPEALEYRGEAYLELSRVDDARQSYMTLFATSRTLADQLMGSMQKWVSAHREGAPGVASDQVDVFAQWITERLAIAQQTASLGLDKSTVSWK
jgi:tetratricopeptide (TPR) repeat protein